MKKKIFTMVLVLVGVSINAQWTENNGTLSADSNITKVRVGSVDLHSTFNVDGRLFIGKHSNGSGITYQPNVGVNWYAGLDFSDSWAIRNGSSNFFYVKNDGRVGVGTSIPMEKLHVDGRIYLGGHQNGTGTWYKSSSGGNWFSGLNSDNQWRILKNEGTSGPNQFLIDTNGNIGIGSNAPIEKLHINGRVYLGDHSNGAGVWYKSPGGSSGTDWFVGLKPNNAWRIFKDGDDKFTILPDGNVGIGTSNPGSWKLAVLGKIRATEIKVEAAPWPDYVFNNEYHLPTLAEVEQHIQEKGHLKDIPSAKEVEKNGIFVGEMNAKLLQKIEELTLYTIEQEKKINELEKEKKRNDALEKRLLIIEKVINKK